ncbi:MAG: methyltransferase domain-containing protein [Planctomycetia bacterium]|nr:MAG: methyltransferase domain-containing protein [Planctomycetia bacterium]
MSDYLQYLEGIYGEKSFQRKLGYIEHNFRRLFSPGQRVLEIGPGFGEFLTFCNRVGITDIDIIDRDAGVARHVAEKYNVRHLWIAEAEDLAPIRGELRRYDRIFLMQIMEHVRKSALIPLLRTLYAQLNAGGALIITVPNGGTPLGLVERYSDITHENVFSELSLRQLASMAELPHARVEVRGFCIPPSDLLNIVRIGVQKLLHTAVKLVMIANGGVYFQIYHPNITLIVHREA